jgi:glyoxylase-like metal-dependent hydrolase (beta-lactamase superfamily II)
MTIVPLGDLRIHSYQAPETGVFANTQILETKNRLIVVDTQFLRAHAEEVRRYADDLDKPIDRVIVTHSHPDHWFGNEYYDDTPVYALPEVADEIRQGGEAMIQRYGAAFGDAVTKKKITPTHVICPGPETIDGLRLVFTKADGTESSVNLVIELPDQRVLVGQDLLYNRVHAFLRQKDLEPWLVAIRRFMQQQYDLVLAGHGLPGNMQVLADLERYLTDAKEALAKSMDIQTLKSVLKQMYPYYQGEGIIDISGNYLYPPKS